MVAANLEPTFGPQVGHEMLSSKNDPPTLDQVTALPESPTRSLPERQANVVFRG